MPKGIVGENLDYPFSIDAKDLREFLRLEEIDIAWITLGIMYGFFSDFQLIHLFLSYID